MRTGRTSSGAATAKTAATHATRSSGNPHRDQRSASITSQSDSTTRPRMSPTPTTRISATSTSRARAQRRRNENVDDDHEGENRCGHEGDPPERLRPPENGDERLGGFLVDRSRRGGDDGGQAYEERPDDQARRVDRAPMPPPRLGGRQEHEIPGASGICQSDTRRRDCRAAVAGRQGCQAPLDSWRASSWTAPLGQSPDAVAGSVGIRHRAHRQGVMQAEGRSATPTRPSLRPTQFGLPAGQHRGMVGLSHGPAGLRLMGDRAAWLVDRPGRRLLDLHRDRLRDGRVR